MSPINISVDELIKAYDLQPHPEGGYFKEIYRSTGHIAAKALPEKFGGDRCYSTDIFFLLPQGTRSRLHRIKSDELWHFYLGGSLTLVQISLAGQVEQVVMGSDVRKGQKLQHVVPAGYWFGAYPNFGSTYSLVGCTVIPGFEFADFEMGEKEILLREFPHARSVIERLTP